tara:strand:+ start:7970 stop:8713 length:744 start_codon:yes stop_codon:yes gene_type:complete
MSNHYHLVLKVEPNGSASLADDEIADRWLKLCPGRRASNKTIDSLSVHKAALLSDPERLTELRARLSSLSWFMRFINEPLARLANKEDQCTGRFWEGRFRSQALLDEASVLASMVYVDLNPIRAGIANDIEESEFTSLLHRLSHLSQDESVVAINGEAKSIPFEPMELTEYISLVRWSSKLQLSQIEDPPPNVHRCLGSNHTNADSWFRYHLPKPNRWQSAIGSIDALRSHAAALGQRWIKRRSWCA